MRTLFCGLTFCDKSAMKFFDFVLGIGLKLNMKSHITLKHTIHNATKNSVSWQNWHTGVKDVWINIQRSSHSYWHSRNSTSLYQAVIDVYQRTYFSAASTRLDEQSDLNSGSHFSRNDSSSFTMLRMLLPLIRAKHSSIARLPPQHTNIRLQS